MTEGSIPLTFEVIGGSKVARAADEILNIDNLVTALSQHSYPDTDVIDPNMLVVKKIMRMLHNLKDSLDVLFADK